MRLAPAHHGGEGGDSSTFSSGNRRGRYPLRRCVANVPRLLDEAAAELGEK